jgi:L-serine dehydratase
MESISIFEIFKISIGPSSSHTLGPWKAAIDFIAEIEREKIDKLSIELYGSLSKTGKGHATDKAIQLGLLGIDPEVVETNLITQFLEELESSKKIIIGNSEINFSFIDDIIFTQEDKPEHPNTIIFKAFFNKKLLQKNTYYSVGGGFIEKVGEKKESKSVNLPYPIQKTVDLQKYVESTNLTIPEIVMENEKSLRSEKEVKLKIDSLFETIKSSVVKGCLTKGILPGGLKVVRRANNLCESLTDQSFESFEDLEGIIKSESYDFNAINKWISCFALAVNEENAAMGRVVTAPTNGAAGVIPAVLLYYYFFCEKNYNDDIYQFFLTAGELGSLYKKGATISAAMGGCQAEIGVSSSMAAGALTKILGGNYEQVLMASEIAMEHHLGLTCDPIGGLVQIPCIERNTMGAIKAITAANLAIEGNPRNMKVNLDTIIKTMWDTAQAMDNKFKETSEGGLAINISVGLPEC